AEVHLVHAEVSERAREIEGERTVEVPFEPGDEGQAEAVVGQGRAVPDLEIGGQGVDVEQLAARVQAGHAPAHLEVGPEAARGAEHARGRQVRALEAPLQLRLVRRLHPERTEAEAETEAPGPLRAEEVHLTGDGLLEDRVEVAAHAAAAEVPAEPPARGTWRR